MNAKLEKYKQYLLLGGLAVLGVCFLLLGNGDKPSSLAEPVVYHAQVQNKAVTEDDLVTAMEQKLAATLSKIQGAGQVTVQLSVKSTGRKEYAVDTQYTSRTSTEESGDSVQQTSELQEQTNIVQQNQNGAQQALLLETFMPEITGVLVVSSGAVDAEVQERLLKAVTAVLQVPRYQIMVVPGEAG